MWMELESIMLNEISDFTHMWNLRNKTDEHKEKKERQSGKWTLNYREQTDGYWRGGGRRMS